MFRINIMSVLFCVFLVQLVSAITADERQDAQDQNSVQHQQPTSYTFQTIRFGAQPGFQQLLQTLQQNSAQLESFDTPQAPQTPQIPQIPQRPNIPNIPQPPAIPQYPTVSQIPQYPQYPQTYSTNVFSTGQLPLPILPGQPLPSYSLNTIIPQGQYPYNLNSAAAISNNYPLVTNYHAGFATPINPNQLGQGRTFTVPAANPAFNPATPDPDSQTFPVNEVDGLTA